MNIILGVYNEYNSLKTSKGGIYFFFKSLRKYTNCKVIIICEKHNISQELIDFSNEMDFEIYSDFIMKYQMRSYRFEIYNDYLKPNTFDKVLLTDIDDVIFQEDPFSINFTEDLYCALEQSILSDETNDSSLLNMKWIDECGLSKNNYKNKYVICTGTILGSYNGVIEYLDFYRDIQNNKGMNDQGVLNVYAYNYLQSKKCLEYKKSKILTLDKIDFNTLNIKNHSILNSKGEKYSIIHQINRCNLPFMLSLVTLDFYISITTIKKYSSALNMLLNSLPEYWKNKYILVYQNEPENHYEIFEDGHIEVYITNNLSDYGNFVGVNILLQANIIPENSWFLFIHDTCKFLDNCVDLTYDLISNNDSDIVWLCNTGQCNICLIRKNAIENGNNIYKDITFMSKMETIEYEWNHHHKLSPKSLNVKQRFLDIPAKHLGKRYVYNNINERDCLLYESINMEKYYFNTRIESDHPFSP